VASILEQKFNISMNASEEYVMSWFVLPFDGQDTTGISRGESWWMRTPPAPHATRPNLERHTLGTSAISGDWGWAEQEWRTPSRTGDGLGSAATQAPEANEGEHGVMIRVPRAVLRMMTQAARTTGRDEGDVWAEAAREWLSQRRREGEPQPPTPAAAALAVPRPARSWAAIDALLSELREDLRVPAARTFGEGDPRLPAA
jgi:hypothetical protein